MKTGQTNHVETWYQIQYSIKGADDWYDQSSHYDNAQTAWSAMVAKPIEGFELRLVRKTLTEKVLAC